MHLNLIFETGKGDVYYVQVPRPMDSDVDTLREVLPIGSQNVIFLMSNDDPISEGWFNVRDDGNEWFFTTPQGWIVDHPKRGITWPLDQWTESDLEDPGHDHDHPAGNGHDHDHDHPSGNGRGVENRAPEQAKGTPPFLGTIGMDEVGTMQYWVDLAD